MEEKDIKDVCALFLDHAIGEGSEEINRNKIRRAGEKDKKLALTVTLNLRNITERLGLLEKWLQSSDINKVVDRIHSVLDVLPRVDKNWNKPWWNTAVETPMID
jgi:hypothetical protein